MRLIIPCCLIFFLAVPLIYANEEIKSLENKLETASDQQKIGILIDLAKAYSFSSSETSIKYAEEALKLSKQFKDQKGQALASHILGISHKNASNYDQALKYHLNALKIREKLKDQQGISDSLHNIGIVNDYIGNFDVALENYQESLKIREELGDKNGIADSYKNMGILFYFSKKYPEALEAYLKSLNIFEELGDKNGIAKALNNAGYLYQELEKYDTALEHYLRALGLFEEINNQYEVANLSNNIGRLYIVTKSFDKANTALKRAQKIAKEAKTKELIRENYEIFSEMAVSLEDYKLALEYFKNSTKIKDEIFSEKQSKNLTEMKTKYETDKKEQQLVMTQLELGRQTVVRNSFIGGFAFVLILIIVLYNRFLLKQRANKELSSANYLIMEEKEKSDKLLLNILPSKVAEDLKEYGTSEPESFEDVTVYFSDIVGFTMLSSKLEPKTLILELSEIFTVFDTIIAKHECERVKTIGDAYLCVCGMPLPNPNHAENMLLASMEIVKYLNKRNETNEHIWRIRVGLHTGPVVGGIVGVKKYIYDVFGDTINTASRMESNSEPMRINISQVTYDLLGDKYKFEARPPMQVKGKGEMHMFFVSQEEIDKHPPFLG